MSFRNIKTELVVTRIEANEPIQMHTVREVRMATSGHEKEYDTEGHVQGN